MDCTGENHQIKYLIGMVAHFHDLRCPTNISGRYQRHSNSHLSLKWLADIIYIFLFSPSSVNIYNKNTAIYKKLTVPFLYNNAYNNALLNATMYGNSYFLSLPFKTYLLFDFFSKRKSNELRLKPMKNYVDLTDQKFKVLCVYRFFNFSLYREIYALRWWQQYMPNFCRWLGYACTLWCHLRLRNSSEAAPTSTSCISIRLLAIGIHFTYYTCICTHVTAAMISEVSLYLSIYTDTSRDHGQRSFFWW